jgi:ABC-type antimicrobial peptide transport system permease subunit
MLESVSFAFESLRGNRLRTALSLIGIVIGVASVVAVTTIAGSGAADVRRQFETYGLDAVQILPSWDNTTGVQLLRLDSSLAAAIQREIPDAKAVLSRSELPGRLAHARSAKNATVIAVDSPYAAAMGAKMAVGSFFTPEDEYRARNRIVLGSDLARELFPEGEPVGKALEFTANGANSSFEVIGILAPKDAFFLDDWNTSAYIPFSTASRRISGNLAPSILTVVARSRDRVMALGDSLTSFLTARTGNPASFRVISPKEWAEQNEQLTKTISLILGGVAAISLLVGGIGIMNIMLVSVTERKKEIGLRKALGATGRDIRRQFLVEASVLTVAGGALGLLFGFGISYLAVQAFKWRFVASFGTAAVAVGVSMATGLFSGLYPAIRAARLDPVEALSAE